MGNDVKVSNEIVVTMIKSGNSDGDESNRW